MFKLFKKTAKKPSAAKTADKATIGTTGKTRRTGLRNKLALLLLLFGVTPAVLLFAVFLFSKAEFESGLAKPVANLAVQINDVVDRSLFERYGDVQAFGLNTAALDARNYYNPYDGNTLVEAMNKYVAHYRIYKLMLLIDTGGEVIAVNTVDPDGNTLETTSLYGRSFAEATWFQDPIEGRFLTGSNGLTGTAVGHPYREPMLAELFGEEHDFVIPFAAPVKDKNGTVIGVWVNFADFRLVEDILAQFYRTLEADGMGNAELTLLDEEGRVLVDYDPKGLGWTDYQRDFGVVRTLNLIEAGVTAAARAVTGERGSMVSPNPRKQISQVAGYARSAGALDFPGLGWSMLVRIPVNEAYALIGSVQGTMQIMIIVVALFTLLAGAWIGTWFTRPILKLTEATTLLAEGDRDAEVPARDRLDEIGSMARAVQVFKEAGIEMERMAAERLEMEKKNEERRQQETLKLADHFEQSIMEVVNRVGAAATEMTSTAEAMTSAADMTKDQAVAATKATEGAATSVQSVASASEELAASISEISRQVNQASDTARDAAAKAESTNEAVTGLSQSAERIGEVLNMITDIAEQTNLLALNATIEAARAGDAGKGFAVVASEVKSLANQSANATDEIGQQIADIRQATATSAEAIKEIAKTVQQINEISTTIASSVEEQNASTDEISQSAQQAATGTEQVNQNIASVTAAAGETGQAAEQVLNSASELSEQAAALQTQVRKFLDEVRAA